MFVRCSLLLALGALACQAAAADAPYASQGFLPLPKDIQLGAVSAVAVGEKDRVYVLHRGEPPILMFDAQHKYLGGFGQKLFKVAHGLRTDKAGNIWTTDNGNHVLRKFSPQGELLATLGEVGVAGGDETRFRSPDDLVFDSAGDILVADAGNSRIVRLSPAGKFISQFGRKGKLPGEFTTAHALAIDSRDRIYVADRGAKRVQVFDRAGKHLASWTGFGNPFGLLVIGNELIVTEGDIHRVFHFDLAQLDAASPAADGKITAAWGDPKSLLLPHLMAVDRNGTLFIAEVNGQRVQMFSRVRPAAKETATQTDQGFRPLFAGDKLDGWVEEQHDFFKRLHPRASTWSVKDGVVACDGSLGNCGFLRYEKQLCDFVLRLEFRMTAGCNSGVGFRAAVPYTTLNPNTLPSNVGFELQIMDDAGQPPTKTSSGALYNVIAPLASAVHAAGEWNSLELECVGPSVRAKLNGQLVQDLDQNKLPDTGARPLCGFLSLQNHGHSIDFRNVRVKELAEKAPGQQSRLDADLLIVGGTESGVAAAIQAARMGVKRIVLVNDIDWLGGQFTAEALCAIDENRGRKGTNEPPFPRSGLFKELLDKIESENEQLYGARRPGNTVVATTCRPASTEKLFRQMLAPYVNSGQVRLISGYYPASAILDSAGQRLQGLRFAAVDEKLAALEVAAAMTIDASDWGEAIQAAGAEYECGPDLQSAYDEPSAPKDREQYPATDMNPITWCVVVVESDREQPIDKPAGYDDRRYLRSTTLTEADHRALGWPHGQNICYGDATRVFHSRRLVDTHGPATKASGDVLLLNWPTQNYPLDALPQQVVDALEKTAPGASRKNIVAMTRAQRQIIFDDAKRHALGYLYHLQTTVHDRLPSDMKKFSLRRFTLSDEFGTPDRLPPKPYIRESLRLKAMLTMREQDTLKTDRALDRYAAVMYDDGIGCWQFEYDFHPTGRGFLSGEGPAGPWEAFNRPGRGWGPYSDRALFPLGSLVPRRVDGLLGAQKNLGFSSIVSAAVRLHDQSMMVGQAAGATAAVSLRRGVQPRGIPENAALLDEVRAGLCSALDGGVPLSIWPFADLQPDHPAFAAANLLAARRWLPLARADVNFQPDEPATAEWRQRVVELSLARKAAPASAIAPTGDMTRGKFAIRWLAALRESGQWPVGGGR